MRQDDARIKAQQLLQESAALSRASADKQAEASELLGAMGSIVGDTERGTHKSPSTDSVTYIETKLTDNPLNNGNLRAHGYSKRQAFNADETLISMPGGDYKIVDLQGNVIITEGVNSEHCWHTINPRQMFGVAHPNDFGVWDMDNGFQSLYKSERPYLQMGKNEGSVSDDNRYVVLNDDKLIHFFDIENKRVLWSKPVPASFNWAGVSRGGAYVVIVSTKRVVYDRTGVEKFTIPRNWHDDFQYISIAGQWREVLVYMDDTVRTVLLETGEVLDSGLRLLGHFSGRGPKGTMHYSADEAAPPGADLYSIGQFDIGEGVSSFQQWAKVSHSGSKAYANQMKATASPSGRYMIYTSDKEGVANEYLVERSYG